MKAYLQDLYALPMPENKITFKSGNNCHLWKSIENVCTPITLYYVSRGNKLIFSCICI